MFWPQTMKEFKAPPNAARCCRCSKSQVYNSVRLCTALTEGPSHRCTVWTGYELLLLAVLAFCLSSLVSPSWKNACFFCFSQPIQNQTESKPAQGHQEVGLTSHLRRTSKTCTRSYRSACRIQVYKHAVVALFKTKTMDMDTCEQHRTWCIGYLQLHQFCEI